MAQGKQTGNWPGTDRDCQNSSTATGCMSTPSVSVPLNVKHLVSPPKLDFMTVQEVVRPRNTFFHCNTNPDPAGGRRDERSVDREPLNFAHQLPLPCTRHPVVLGVPLRPRGFFCVGNRSNPRGKTHFLLPVREGDGGGASQRGGNSDYCGHVFCGFGLVVIFVLGKSNLVPGLFWNDVCTPYSQSTVVARRLLLLCASREESMSVAVGGSKETKPQRTDSPSFVLGRTEHIVFGVRILAPDDGRIIEGTIAQILLNVNFRVPIFMPYRWNV